MAKEIVVQKDDKTDPIAAVLNPTKDKLPQYTIIPVGGVNAFSMSKTIQQFGRENAFDGLTPMEYYMDKIFEYSRSKQGVLLGGALKLAQTKVEVQAEQTDRGRNFLATD